MPKSDSDYIKLERTVCFGSCPDYTVTVYSNGRYVFRGGGVVLTEKSVKGRISPADAASIIQAADSMDFLNFPDNIDELCVGMVTDGPQVTISLVDSAHVKIIREQACDIYEDSKMEYFEERAAIGLITQQEQKSRAVNESFS